MEESSRQKIAGADRVRATVSETMVPTIVGHNEGGSFLIYFLEAIEPPGSLLEVYEDAEDLRVRRVSQTTMELLVELSGGYQ